MYIRSSKTKRMKKILLTTDFSENAQTAIEYGLQLFGSENVSYTLLNTYKEPGSSTAAMVSITDYLRQESETLLGEALVSLKEKYPQHTIATSSIYGSLYPVINALASKDMADIIVVGTRGATQVQNFFLGSNTMDVLRNVQIPTVVVPRAYSFEPIKTIALAVDFKPLGDVSILEPVIDLAKEKGAAINAFHIQESGDDVMTAASPEVVRLFSELGDIQHQFDNILNENVAAGIGGYMNESHAEMLSIVARKHNFIERLFQKSITKEVSLLATFPLFVVREK